MKKLIFTLLGILTIMFSYAQIQPVDVSELTIKVGGMKTVELYYGFAEGDQIVFNFEEVKGKTMKEIEIIELPSNSKFMDYKSSSISDKKIKVNKKSVYKFVFKNSTMSGRICKVKIQRIPKNKDLISFNTDWEWKTLYDTTYVPYTEDSIVGYDTTYVPYTKKELVRIDTIYDEIQSSENKIWVYSGGNLKACFGKSASCTKQMIPLKYNPNTEVLLIWVGVGQETRNAYNSLSKGLAKVAVKGGTAFLSSGSSVLVSSLSNNIIDNQINNLPTSKNVLDIFLTNSQSATQWYNAYNTSIYDYAFKGLAYKDRVNLKMTLKKELGQISPNTMTLCLKNNSKAVGVEAYVNVVAVRYNKIFEDKKYKKEKITARKITLNKKRMVVKTRKIRINAG